ncbi:autotransporter domain-containing protein [Porphyrobacter sp. SLTP]|uniref:autotransporter domain-containing protein n=1 Tax=Porphyrobacter sp. SLTP TaxID=2683266 RepID=UPI0014120C1F|nr:autotransporter domain-containing protein [Porphyrobacter sp. SLTP]NBB26142.1 autotransporter domain-containing protein [Porphyrobacter sp. SLTP]
MSFPMPLNRRLLLAGTAYAAFSIIAAPALAVVPNEDKTPADIVDNADEYRGVGMFFRADGFVCTGSLINPRTVLFAAHCVNDIPEEQYNVDGVSAAWSFNVNALPGFQNWFANNFASNPDLAVFNVNRIVWNARSTQDAFGLGFIEADVALASLDTPAVGIPTWALLFSTLPAPATSDPARGTGYRVNIVGYGATGNAVQGAVLGIDWRRRAAENMLGGFFSLDDRDDIVFGPSTPTFPQNLYQIDFDSQDRDFPRDFNVYRDDALPNEGITAGGDSGGPLILDAANNALSNEDLVIGVLSGGSRFFGASQPFSSLGTPSFYQPLSLHWQYIIANNPYRYVAAKAGNGNWEDDDHWVTQLDPMYRVINAQGQVVNGLPTTPELGPDGTGGDFGAVCRVSGDPDDLCTDLATGEPFAATGTLPAPTLANGLPGASGFPPNNVDAVTTSAVRIDPRYYDVTLSQDGTTSLSSDVTIDRLTVRGNAGLTVNAAGDLTALIDINQFGGRVNVNGGIASVGDYTLFAGMLEGTGTITAPFLTSVTGVLSPGSMGTIGTLTIDGNLVMSSGAQFNVDLGPGAASDRLAVTGIANVGGIVNIDSAVNGQVNGHGERYTIVTGTGGVTGTFTPRSLSAIISQRFIYQPNAVLMEFSTASYTTVIDGKDPVQAGYAQLFDQNRTNASLASLYGLDFASVGTIRSTFTGLAPVNEQAVRSLAAQSLNLLQNVNAARQREADKSRAGGKVAVTGRPLDLAQMNLAAVGQPLGGALMAMQDGGDTTEETETSLPENVGLFLSGGYVSANADSLPGFTQQTDLSGYFIAGGIEFYPGDNTMVGLSGTYTALEADVPLGQRVDGETYAASLNLRHAVEGGPVIDGQFSMGSMGFDTRRSVPFLGATQMLESSSDDLLVSGALGISYDLKSSIGTVSPRIEGRIARVSLGTVRETGGSVGLAVARERFESKQARFGFDYEKRGKGVAVNANAQLVWEFEDGPQLLAANFASGIGPNADFVHDTADHTWGEVGISATVGRGPLQLTVGADTTIGRDNADAQLFRGTATYRF